jgi:REP element-mobilizing transposase RayT
MILIRAVPAGNRQQLSEPVWLSDRDCDADRAVYLKLLHENMDLYGVALIGYCLMSNHSHLIATPTKAGIS